MQFDFWDGDRYWHSGEFPTKFVDVNGNDLTDWFESRTITVKVCSFFPTTVVVILLSPYKAMDIDID